MAEKDEYQEIFQEAEGDQEKELIPEKGGSGKIELDKEATDEVNPLEEYLITEEMAKEYGFDRKLVGKPLKEGFNSYKELQKFDTKLSQQLADVQRKFGEYDQKLSKLEVKATEEKVEEKLPDFDEEMTKFQQKAESFIDDDGFITDKKGYSQNEAEKMKFIRTYNDKKEELLKKELNKALEEKNAPTAQSVQTLQEQQYLADLYDYVREGLEEMYEGVTDEHISEVIQEYGEEMASDGKEMEGHYINLYKGRPQKFARDIIKHHKVNKPAEKSSEAEQAAKEAHNKQIEKLKKTEKTFVKSAASGRETKEKIKKEDEPYVDLINESLDNEFSQERFGKVE